jgi:hypothetical protein
VLNREELMLGVQAGVGAIGKLGDELVARDVALVVILIYLVDESTLDVRGCKRKDALVLDRVSDILNNDRALAGSDNSSLAMVTSNQLR